MIEVSMLSRGKLVQDWRRKLTVAESEAAECPSHWIVRVRLRLYRFLLSCYGQTDWRADEPSLGSLTEERSDDTLHGDTTTLLDAQLGGKPAKSIGKMQAVLKAVSAAQEQPAAGPLLHGIAADDWVVVASPRDKLQMHGCQELLKGFGIETSWGSQGELKVRHFDLEQAAETIGKHRYHLMVKLSRIPYPLPLLLRPALPVTSWPIRLAILGCIFGPPFAATGALFVAVWLSAVRESPVGREFAVWFAILYVGFIVTGVICKWNEDLRRNSQERRDARWLVDEERMRDNRHGGGESY
jgi:hypothetical protein